MALLTRYQWLAMVLLLFAAPISRQAYADDNLQLGEQQIKAGLLYNFLKYTEWPQADKSTSINVCIFGDDPFGGYLQPMAGRTVNQQAIAIRTVHNTHDTSDCRLLFVNASAKGQWPELRQFIAEKHILTVSDFTGFTDAGGMIEFTHKDDHISLNLNMDAVTGAQLHVQDRLLRLVTVIHPAGEK